MAGTEAPPADGASAAVAAEGPSGPSITLVHDSDSEAGESVRRRDTLTAAEPTGAEEAQGCAQGSSEPMSYLAATEHLRTRATRPPDVGRKRVAPQSRLPPEDGLDEFTKEFRLRIRWIKAKEKRLMSEGA